MTKMKTRDREQASGFASIGPITSDTAKKLGLTPDIEPKEFTTSALADAIEEYFKV